MGWENKAKKYASTAEKVLDSKWTAIALIILIVFIAFGFRAAPADLPVTDSWAAQTLQNNYVSQAEAQVRQQFPNLPQAQARQQAVREYERFAAENQDQIAEQQAQLSQEFKRQLQFEIERPDGSTYYQTYLSEIDPYHYLQHAERILDTGSPCTRVVDGVCWNDYSMAPVGTGAVNDWHVRVAALFAWVAVLFGFIPLTGVYWMPAILGALVTVPTFFFVKRRFGALGAAAAALYIGLHTALLPRTVAGFSSTDAWNILLPVTIIWTVAVALEQDVKWKSWSWLVVAAALTGIYSQFWNAWWYTFFIMMLVLIAVGGYKALSTLLAQYRDKKKGFNIVRAAKNAQEPLLLALGYIVITGLVTTLVSGFSRFTTAFTQPFTRAGGAGGLQSVANIDLWPNVMRTVAELSPSSINSTIGNMGGLIVFFVATMGLIVTMLRTEELDGLDYKVLGGVAAYYIALLTPVARGLDTLTYLALYAIPFVALIGYNLYFKESPYIHYAVIGAGWMLAGLFTITQGIRFQLLLLIPIGIGIGFFIGWAMKLSIKLSKEQFDVPHYFGRIAIVALALTILFAPVGANLYERASIVSENHSPLINDAWWNVLEDIKDDSEPDAIITSWWDFGHWFKYVADRGVNFDGSRQNTPAAHWVGNLLLNDDNRVSVGTIRLLNCGGNQGYNTIRTALNGDNVEAYHVIDDIRSLGRADAQATLAAYGFSQEVIDQTIEYTHCQPPESYLIVSEDMIGKAPVWGHFGGWDFDRAQIQRIVATQPQATATQRLVEDYGYSQAEAIEMYQTLSSLSTQNAAAWVSPWPQYAGTASCTRGNDISSCRLGLQLGTQDGIPLIADRLEINHQNITESQIIITAQGQSFPLSPSYLSVDGQSYDLGGDFPVGLSVQGSQVIIADESLVDSLFTQLFINEEPGPFFVEVSRERQLTGGKIIAYKVDWDAYFAEVE